MKYDETIPEDKEYWINHINILTFPDHLFSCKTNELQLKKNVADSILNIFFFDVTNSASLNKISNTILNEFNQSEIKEIEFNEVNNSNQILAAYLLKLLSTHSNKNNYLFYTYSGGDTTKHKPVIFNKENVILDYDYYNKNKILVNAELLYSLNKISNNKLNTCISNFINVEYILRDKIPKEYKIKIYFISDFIDNTNYELSNLEPIIQTPDLMSINIIKTFGKDINGKDVYNKIYENVNNHPDLIKSNCVSLTSDLEWCKTKLNLYDLCFNDNTKDRDSSIIYFRYPKLSRNSTIGIEASFNILSTKNSTYLIKITDIDNLNNTDYYNVKLSSGINKIGFTNGDYVQLDNIRNIDTVLINMPNYFNIENHRAMLEIFDQENKLLNSFQIKVIPDLPYSNKIYLVVMYTILISSICLIFFYVHFYQFYINAKDLIKDSFVQKRILLIISLSLIPIIYYTFSTTSILILKVKLITFIFITLVTSIHFYRFLSKSEKYCKLTK